MFVSDKYYNVIIMDFNCISNLNLDFIKQIYNDYHIILFTEDNKTKNNENIKRKIL